MHPAPIIPSSPGKISENDMEGRSSMKDISRIGRDVIVHQYY